MQSAATSVELSTSNSAAEVSSSGTVAAVVSSNSQSAERPSTDQKLDQTPVRRDGTMALDFAASDQVGVTIHSETTTAATSSAAPASAAEAKDSSRKALISGGSIGESKSSLVHAMPPVAPRPPKTGGFPRSPLQHRGIERDLWSDLFVHVLGVSWWRLIFYMFLTVTAINIFFAAFLMIQPGGFTANEDEQSFAWAFYLAYQTFSTVGFGGVYPQTKYANVIIYLLTLTGLVTTTVFTGLIFSKFARPIPKLRFSSSLVICNYEDVPTLKLRVSNMYGPKRPLLYAVAEVYIFREETTKEGKVMRRLRQLQLEREKWPFFVAPWMVMHQVKKDNSSPFYGETRESLIKSKAQLWVNITAVDSATSDTVYTAEEIEWSSDFADTIRLGEDKKPFLDYAWFDCIEPAKIHMRADPNDRVSLQLSDHANLFLQKLKISTKARKKASAGGTLPDAGATAAAMRKDMASLGVAALRRQ